MGNNWKESLKEVAHAVHTVKVALDGGHISDESLFSLLSDENERVRRMVEGELNAAVAGSVFANRVDKFVQFLRSKLGVEGEGLPDSWVVKSFGFNLVTGERLMFDRFLEENTTVMPGRESVRG